MVGEAEQDRCTLAYEVPCAGVGVHGLALAQCGAPCIRQLLFRKTHPAHPHSLAWCPLIPLLPTWLHCAAVKLVDVVLNQKTPCFRSLHVCCATDGRMGVRLQRVGVWGDAVLEDPAQGAQQARAAVCL